MNTHPEGELAVDVFQTPTTIVVQAAIAGVGRDNIHISLNHHTLTITGTRTPPREVPHEDYIWRECFWGNFSRTIILPSEVDNTHIQATLVHGVLTITLPKK